MIALWSIALAGAEPLIPEVDEPPAPLQALAASTTLGGYAQIGADWRKVGPDGPYDGTATLRRFVVYLAHDFSDQMSMQTEVEWEHAVACSGCLGTVEIEQLAVAWEPSAAMGVRGGLLLLPMGIVNLWHEPPVFHGVERPAVEETVIPTTWRELGVGVYGEPTAGVRYQANLTTAPDPLGLGPSGIGGGRTLGSLAAANGFAGSARVEWEPRLGSVLGVSGYAADLGPNAEFYDGLGRRLDLAIPVYAVDIDGRVVVGGLQARLLGVGLAQPQADDLMEGLAADGRPYFPEGTGTVATRSYGAYGEIAYDVLHGRGDAALAPFARIERYDTQYRLPDEAETDSFFAVTDTVLGVTWKPLPSVAVKADTQWRDRDLGDDEHAVRVGLGFLY